jgi:hypothetical protein
MAEGRAVTAPGLGRQSLGHCGGGGVRVRVAAASGGGGQRWGLGERWASESGEFFLN